jgi:hypothetical protein
MTPFGPANYPDQSQAARPASPVSPEQSVSWGIKILAWSILLILGPLLIMHLEYLIVLFIAALILKLINYCRYGSF